MKDECTACHMSIKALRRLAKADGSERVMARIALAFHYGKGVRLSGSDVAELFGPDDALHARLYMNYDATTGERRDDATDSERV